MARRPPRNPRAEPRFRKAPIGHSKRVLDRIRAARHLRGAIRSLKDAAAAGFRLRFESELQDGETVPDLALTLEVVGRSVQTAIDRLVKVDNEYCRLAMERGLVAGACDFEAREQVYPALVDVRREIDGLFHREDARRLHGMTGRTRRRRKLLYPQLAGLVGALQSPERKMPRPRREGAVVDRGGWLARLEPGYTKLTTMLEALQVAELRELAMRDQRDAELERFDTVYSEGLDYVRSVYRLGGYGKKVLWHLLPTVQRRRLKGDARREREAREEGRRPARKPSEDDDATVVVEPPKGPTRVA